MANIDEYDVLFRNSVDGEKPGQVAEPDKLRLPRCSEDGETTWIAGVCAGTVLLSHNVLYGIRITFRFRSLLAIDHQLTVTGNRQLSDFGGMALPCLFLDAGDQACRRFIEFFTANIRNRNTREAYGRAVGQFSAWCEDHKLALGDLTPFLIAAYIEEVAGRLDRPSVKQHLAAIRMLFDYLVIGQVMPANPAASVRGPKHVVKKGKTPVLSADECRELIESIDISTIVGLRDRAIIGAMVYSFGRVSAVVGMDVEDYYVQGRRMWFRLREKGGKRHEVPAHHKAEEFLDEYLAAAGIALDRRSPLFRSVDRRRQLTARRMHRREVLAMIKRRARVCSLPASICCHTFRATGITAYLSNGGQLEHAQQIAAHESPRTTKLYDRTRDEITLDEIERIVI